MLLLKSQKFNDDMIHNILVQELILIFIDCNSGGMNSEIEGENPSRMCV